MKKLIMQLVIALLTVACGSEEGKPVDPGNVEVARMDFSVYSHANEAMVKIMFNSALPLKNLDYYGWYGMVAVSDKETPAICDGASYRAYLLQAVDLQNLKPGIHYVRACAGNNRNGYISPGITGQFEIEVDELPTWE